MDKYANFDSTGMTVTQGVKTILEAREGLMPFDIRVDCKVIQLLHLDNAYKLTCTNSTDLYLVGDGALRSLMYLLDISHKIREQLEPATLVKVVNEMLQTRHGGAVLLRCARIQNELHVRSILSSRYGIMEDRQVFGSLPKLIQQAGTVSSVWTSDTHSAIRVMLGPLPKLSEHLGAKATYGLDVVNSDVFIGSAWVKGVIEVVLADNRTVCFVVPKLLVSARSAEAHVLQDLVREILATDVEELDGLSRLSFDGLSDKTSLGPVFGRLQKEEKLARKDVIAILNQSFECAYTSDTLEYSRNDLREVATTFWDISKAIVLYAAGFNSYVKRSELEFIPNIWLRKLKN